MRAAQTAGPARSESSPHLPLPQSARRALASLVLPHPQRPAREASRERKTSEKANVFHDLTSGRALYRIVPPTQRAHRTCFVFRPSPPVLSDVGHVEEPDVAGERDARFREADDRTAAAAVRGNHGERGAVGGGWGGLHLDFDGVELLVRFENQVDLAAVVVPVVPEGRRPPEIAEGLEDFGNDGRFEDGPGIGAVPQGLGRGPSGEMAGEAGVREVEFRGLGDAVRQVARIGAEEVDEARGFEDGEPGLGGVGGNSGIPGKVGHVERLACPGRAQAEEEEKGGFLFHGAGKRQPKLCNNIAYFQLFRLAGQFDAPSRRIHSESSRPRSGREKSGKARAESRSRRGLGEGKSAQKNRKDM